MTVRLYIVITLNSPLKMKQRNCAETQEPFVL